MSLKEKADHAYFTRRMFLGAVLPAPLAGVGLALAEMGHTIFFAECNFTELHRVFRYCLIYSLILGILATAGVMVWPQVLDLLFGMEDIGEVGKAYYAARVFCIGTIFMGICLLLQNYLQSEEDEKGAFLVVFMRRLGAACPCCSCWQRGASMSSGSSIL